MNQSAFQDLREYIRTLDSKGLVVKIDKEVKKDTEIHPLVRLQFLGLPEDQRKAFLFSNVVDKSGKRYDGTVAVGCLAASNEIYSMGMGCAPNEVGKKWQNALANPIAPNVISIGSSKEEIHLGSKLLEHGGLEEFPFPISTPGFDNAPYFTACHWVTKDPETGIRNIGNYRAQIKRKDKTGLYVFSSEQDIVTHWEKCAKLGKPLEAVGIIGVVPPISYTSVQKIAYGVDEYAVAGALQGKPIDLVKCVTVDLEVPASAEIVLEGTIRTDYLEPEGPFGESHGYMDPRSLSMVFELKCVTHRKKPILVSILSQMTPSESSTIKHKGWEAIILDHLRNHCSMKSVIGVALHEQLINLRQYVVIQMKKKNQFEPLQAMQGVLGFRYDLGKVIVCVDEDINPEDPVSVNWAICHRCQPHKDMQIVVGRQTVHSPIAVMRHLGIPGGYDEIDSSLLIDATKKTPMPPLSLPKKEVMENALRLWKDLKLPSLNIQGPWYGYSLGYWPAELEEEATLALNGEYYETGEKLESRGFDVKPGESLASARTRWRESNRDRS